MTLFATILLPLLKGFQGMFGHPANDSFGFMIRQPPNFVKKIVHIFKRYYVFSFLQFMVQKLCMGYGFQMERFHKTEFCYA